MAAAPTGPAPPVILLLDDDPALEAPTDRPGREPRPAAPHGAGVPRPRPVLPWPPLEELVAAHYAEVHGLLVRLVARREDADDLAQECFVRAERARGSDAPVRAFLMRTATNLAHDLHRRRGVRGRELELTEDARVTAEDPSRRAAQAELVDALRVEVAGLPDPPRSSFVARVLLGEPYDAIAAALGFEPGTVRIHVMKARRLLEKRLAPWLEETA